MLKDSLVLAHLMFTQQQKQVHHHQHLNFSEHDGSRKAKEARRWCWAQSFPHSLVLLGTVLVGLGHPCPHSDEQHEAQIFLSWWNRERIISIWRFYFIWNVVGWSPWKRECFSFSHYFIGNVTSWAVRESESKHSTSGEMYRKFHLKSELRSGIQNPKKPLSLLTEPPKNCPTYRN